MPLKTFEEFKAEKLRQGFDEVFVHEWAPLFENEPHTHPFDTDALIVHGEYWLNCDNTTTHLKSGDSFCLARHKVHSERYGPIGCVFWSARKNS